MKIKNKFKDQGTACTHVSRTPPRLPRAPAMTDALTAVGYLDSLSWNDFRRHCSNAGVGTGNREQVMATTATFLQKPDHPPPALHLSRLHPPLSTDHHRAFPQLTAALLAAAEAHVDAEDWLSALHSSPWPNKVTARILRGRRSPSGSEAGGSCATAGLVRAKQHGSCEATRRLNGCADDASFSNPGYSEAEAKMEAEANDEVASFNLQQLRVQPSTTSAREPLRGETPNGVESDNIFGDAPVANTALQTSLQPSSAPTLHQVAHLQPFVTKATGATTGT